MLHEIGPSLRTSSIHEAYAVYKNYDGNAPDTKAYAICATLVLAQEVATYLNKWDQKGENRDDDEVPENLVDYPWPYVEGWEHCSCWDTQRVEAPLEKIAVTFETALSQSQPH